MTYSGHVENGVIVLDEAVDLPDGAPVTIELASAPQSTDDEAIPSLAERLASVIGSVDGLPEDAAENHDHYLYGAPKK